MVKIRLKRLGSTKRPFYRIVVSNDKVSRDGRSLAEIGTYNPTTEPASIQIDAQAAKEWLTKGAQPTTVVQRLFKKQNIV